MNYRTYQVGVYSFKSSKHGRPDWGVLVDGGLVGSSPECRRVVVLIQDDDRDGDLHDVGLTLALTAQLVLIEINSIGPIHVLTFKQIILTAFGLVLSDYKTRTNLFLY